MSVIEIAKQGMGDLRRLNENLVTSRSAPQESTEESNERTYNNKQTRRSKEDSIELRRVRANRATSQWVSNLRVERGLRRR